MKPITEQAILAKLRNRPSKGPVKLSYAEADWLINHIENPPMNTLARRVLFDQAQRKRLNQPGTVVMAEEGKRAARPAPPVLDVPIQPPPPPVRPPDGWRGNTIHMKND